MPEMTISVGFGHSIVMSGRDRILDLVAVAEVELQVLALHRGAVADAVDLQPALEALGHARDQVRHHRARHAPGRARLLRLVARHRPRCGRLPSSPRCRRPRRRRARPSAPSPTTFWPSTVAVTPLGSVTGFLPIRDIASTRLLQFVSAGQNTWQSTSPPTFWSRASASDMTPFGVDRMDTPSPLATRGMLFTEA